MSLLPWNSTTLERSLEGASAHRLSIDFKNRHLLDPARCPIDFLPWLAWHFGVDEWDADWPEAVKREVIEASIEVHRRKGTRASVIAALEATGFDTVIAEWFEYGGPPHTARIDTFGTDVFELSIPEQNALFALLRRQIDTTKPVRVHYALRVGEKTEDTGYGRAGAVDEGVERADLTAAPVPAEEISEPSLRIGAADRLEARSDITLATSPATSTGALAHRSFAADRLSDRGELVFEREAA